MSVSDPSSLGKRNGLIVFCGKQTAYFNLLVASISPINIQKKIKSSIEKASALQLGIIANLNSRFPRVRFEIESKKIELITTNWNHYRNKENFQKAFDE